MDGLKDRPKSGRPTEISEEIRYIDKEPTNRKQSGLDDKAG